MSYFPIIISGPTKIFEPRFLGMTCFPGRHGKGMMTIDVASQKNGFRYRVTVSRPRLVDAKDEKTANKSEIREIFRENCRLMIVFHKKHIIRFYNDHGPYQSVKTDSTLITSLNNGLEVGVQYHRDLSTS